MFVHLSHAHTLGSVLDAALGTQDLHQFLDIFGLLRCGAFVPAKFLFLGGLSCTTHKPHSTVHSR